MAGNSEARLPRLSLGAVSLRVHSMFLIITSGLSHVCSLVEI